MTEQFKAKSFMSGNSVAMRLPKGADLFLQTHFHPSGKEEQERTSIGVYFADEPPEKQVVTVQLPPQYAAFHGLDVPAGESSYVIRDSFELPVRPSLHFPRPSQRVPSDGTFLTRREEAAR